MRQALVTVCPHETRGALAGSFCGTDLRVTAAFAAELAVLVAAYGAGVIAGEVIICIEYAIPVEVTVGREYLAEVTFGTTSQTQGGA